jgi:hypothetical protein
MTQLRVPGASHPDEGALKYDGGGSPRLKFGGKENLQGGGGCPELSRGGDLIPPTKNGFATAKRPLPHRKIKMGRTPESSGGGSDIRWKKDIVPLKNVWDKIGKLNGVYYAWRVDEFPEMDFKSGRQVGLIAQDVKKALPEIVTTDDEGYMRVAYEKFAPLFVEAIKQLKAENDALRADIDSLKRAQAGIANRKAA